LSLFLKALYNEMSAEESQSLATLTKVNKILEQLKGLILSTFKRIHCNELMLEELLGLDTTLATHNLIVFLGQIEHRAVELLNILHYVTVKVNLVCNAM